jgi:hypothetical protein
VIFEQLSIFDGLDPTVVATMEPEPGWIWARCPVCAEVRYLRRKDAGTRCILTAGCAGRVEAYLMTDCQVCGKPVTARRAGHDTRYCSKKCEP